MTVRKFEIGQTLWFVPNSRWSQARDATITKIGRVYITLNDLRFRVDDPYMRSENPWGRFYLNQVEYERLQALEKHWNALRRAIDRTLETPTDLTDFKIAQVVAILGLSLKDLAS